MFPTVEEVFSYVRRAPDQDWVEDVQVEFDPLLGFPTLVSSISKPNIADAGGALYLRNATPLR
jgi:hypothetical protein